MAGKRQKYFDNFSNHKIVINIFVFGKKLMPQPPYNVKDLPSTVSRNASPYFLQVCGIF